MVWSSASSTLIGPFAFVVAFVFRSSPNTHPLRPVGVFGKALYRLRHSGSGSAPLRGRRGAHPYVAPCEFERYSPKCVEKLSDNSRRASFRSSRRGATRPEALFERLSCHPGQLPKGAKANYQTVSEQVFSEVRYLQATPSNSKNTPPGRCARAHNPLPCLSTVGRGPEPRPAEGGYPWGVGSQWCNRLPHDLEGGCAYEAHRLYGYGGVGYGVDDGAGRASISYHPPLVKRRVCRCFGLGDSDGPESARHIRLLGRQFRPAGHFGIGRRSFH